MSYESNRKVIAGCDGNYMAWLAQKHIREIEALENDTHCKNCGTLEKIQYLPRYKSNLTDGLCDKCRREFYGE